MTIKFHNADGQEIKTETKIAWIEIESAGGVKIEAAGGNMVITE